MSTILSTSGLTRRFGGLTAVRDVNLRLNAGEIHALIGPNGAGKTTLVSMLIGRVAPTSGAITFLGEDVTALPAHRRVARGMAYTFQVTSVFNRLSVLENVALAARRPHGRGAAAAARTALDRVGLDGRGDGLAGDLDYGRQRLLEIAMGLAQKPRLLILDEPTQGLGEHEIARFKTLVSGLAPETTVLLIEHNMGVVMELAGRITVLDRGAILAEGAPAGIRANAAVQTAYLGSA
jgi:branched-chain amino acid transport system ATP-binding protein